MKNIFRLEDEIAVVTGALGKLGPIWIEALLDAGASVFALDLAGSAALGILAGLVALVFVRTLYATEDVFDRLQIPAPARTALGGAIVGIIGLEFPEVFGVGYEAVNEALRGEIVWKLLLVLVVVKILAVSLTIGSGGSGGIFAPSLFIGAMVGGAVGTVVHGLWPELTGTPGAYAGSSQSVQPSQSLSRPSSQSSAAPG